MSSLLLDTARLSSPLWLPVLLLFAAYAAWEVSARHSARARGRAARIASEAALAHRRLVDAEGRLAVERERCHDLNNLLMGARLTLDEIEQAWDGDGDAAVRAAFADWHRSEDERRAEEAERARGEAQRIASDRGEEGGGPLDV